MDVLSDSHVYRDNKRDHGRDRDIHVRQLHCFEFVQKEGNANRLTHHVRCDDQEVVAEQRQAAAEIAGPQVEYTINK